MGLDHFLELSTNLKPAQALHLLADHLGLKWGDEDHLIGPALWISALDKSPESRAIIEEGFHFSPDLLVLFRLNTNSDDYEDGNRVMLRATMLLLEHGQDGVLLANGERITLQRLGGQLVLNEDAGNWTDGFRLENEISLSHEKRPLPSPLLDP